MDEAKEVRQIPIEDIIPNRFQPRINFDEKALNELAESIKQHGIIQPLVLRPLGDKFEIIAGERRYKAASLAGLSTVPSIVTQMDDGTSAEVALIENVQRKDLTSIEEAKSYKSMLDRGNMTQEELAKKMGLSQSTIANKLRLLNLSEEVQNALMQEKISERHARALLSITDKEEQVKWLNRIIKERLTVRQLDLAIKDELQEKNNANQLGEDIPKVNINPDIESIINNAVDINPQTVKPVETGNNVQNSEIQNPQPEEKTQNKFFNYLEDEEVNMNMNETPAEKTEPAPQEEFGFTPEFKDAPENNFVGNQNVEEIESLDDTPAPPVQNQVSETLPDEPIFNVSEPVTDAVVEETNQVNEVNESSVNEETLSDAINNYQEEIEVVPDANTGVQNEQQVVEVNNNTVVAAPVEPNEVVTENVVTPIANEIESNPQSEFIFDDEDEETVTSTNTIDNSQIDPIPIVEGEGIVDPAAYYDTLDPNFIDKVKEYVGLDLKTAINSYRDLTSELNSKGFQISIDEIDMDKKYHIEININKE